MMQRKQYNERYSYEIFDDGYDIYDYDVLTITQRDPFGKVFDRSKSYEENCIMQLDMMVNPPAPEPGPAPIPQEEMLRADVDFIALMEDLVLPSQEIVPEEEGE